MQTEFLLIFLHQNNFFGPYELGIDIDCVAESSVSNTMNMEGKISTNKENYTSD